MNEGVSGAKPLIGRSAAICSPPSLGGKGQGMGDLNNFCIIIREKYNKMCYNGTKMQHIQ